MLEVIFLKHYERLVDMGCFSRGELAGMTGSDAAANSLIYSYKKKGLIRGIRRDLFAAMSFETKQPVPDRFVIGSRIAPDACISYHSAFEYYGYANQVYYDVYVSSASRFREFEFDGYTYRHIPLTHTSAIEERRGVRVTNIERTVIDSISAFEKIGGLEELLRCIEMIPRLDFGMLSDCLDEYKSGFLYQKAGYILWQTKRNGLSEEFFSYCKERMGSRRSYMTENNGEDVMLDTEWNLIIPKTINGGNY